MDKINLLDYVIGDKYEGCDPVIAEALKQNKTIECKAQKNKTVICINYVLGSNYPYVCLNLEEQHEYYKKVTPIKQKKKVKYVKPFSEIMKWFESVGYTIGTGYIKIARKDLGGTGVFNFEMIQYCGSVRPTCWRNYWREEWLEEREE